MSLWKPRLQRARAMPTNTNTDLKAQLRTPSQIRRAGAKYRPEHPAKPRLRPSDNAGYLSLMRLLHRFLPKKEEVEE
mgnify:CR=1 FL=1